MVGLAGLVSRDIFEVWYVGTIDHISDKLQVNTNQSVIYDPMPYWTPYRDILDIMNGFYLGILKSHYQQSRNLHHESPERLMDAVSISSTS